MYVAGKESGEGFPLCRKLVGFSSPSLFDNNQIVSKKR